MNSARHETSPADQNRQISYATAYFYLVMTAFLWAIGIVISRGVHEFIPPLGMTFWRWFGAAVLLYPFVARQIARDWPATRRQFPRLASLGILIVGSSALLVFALRFTTAINGALINSSQPAIVVVVAWLLFRSRVPGLHLVGIAAAAAGVGVMISRAELAALVGLELNQGDLLIVVATVGYSLYGIMISRSGFGISPWTALFWINFFGGLGILPFYIAESIYFRPVLFNFETVAALFVLAAFVGIISIYLWNTGNRMVGHNRAAIFVNLLPVFGAILAILFLDERLFSYHVIGAVFVVTGVLMVVSKK